MKRTLIIIGALCLLLLTACGQDLKYGNNRNEKSGTQTQSQADAAENNKVGSEDASVKPDAGEEKDAQVAQKDKDSGVLDGGARDSGVVDSGTQNVLPNVFAYGSYGAMVTAGTGTRVEQWDRPDWSKDAVTSAKFIRPDGKEYTMLVYEKRTGERFTAWNARAEVGDSAEAQQSLRTINGSNGYIYSINDHGGVADVHITVDGGRFVYYFHADESEAIVPPDFVQFVRELRVLN